MPIVPAANPWEVGETTSAIGSFQIHDQPKTRFGSDYVAKQFGDAAAEIKKQADEYQGEIDKTRVIDATIKLDRRRDELKRDYEQNRTGESACEVVDGKTLEQEQDEKLKNAQEEITKSLGNGRQRALFTQLADNTRLLHNREVLAYKGKQFETYRASVRQEAQNRALEKVQSEDPETQNAGLQELSALADEVAQVTGQKKDVVRRSMLSGGHALLIAGMVDRGETEDAKLHFEAFRGSMTPDQAEKADALIKGQQEDDKASKAAAGIVAKEKDPAKRYELAESEKAPGLRKKIVARLAVLEAREREEQAALREKAFNASVEYIKKGIMPPNSVMSDLDEMDRWKIEREVEAMQKRRIAEAEARGHMGGSGGGGRAAQALKPSGQKIAELQGMAVNDPESFLAYNPEQNAGTLGQKGVEYIKRLQDDIKRGMSGQFAEVSKQFDEFCAGEGTKLDEKRKARAKALALTNFTNAWRATGGNLTNPEVMNIIKDAVDRGTESRGPFNWEGWLGRSKGGDTYADSDWDATNHGAPQKRKYFTAEENAEAIRAMRAGVVVNNRKRWWNHAIGPDQIYAYNIWVHGTHDYPDEWVVDAKSLIEQFNKTHPKQAIPVNRRNIERIILERRMTKMDDGILK